jgi:hypothetical protein
MRTVFAAALSLEKAVCFVCMCMCVCVCVCVCACVCMCVYADSCAQNEDRDEPQAERKQKARVRNKKQKTRLISIWFQFWLDILHFPLCRTCWDWNWNGLMMGVKWRKRCSRSNRYIN